jgi:hypothetical protein
VSGNLKVWIPNEQGRPEAARCSFLQWLGDLEAHCATSPLVVGPFEALIGTGNGGLNGLIRTKSQIPIMAFRI